jgi:hypothetical protein
LETAFDRCIERHLVRKSGMTTTRVTGSLPTTERRMPQDAHGMLRRMARKYVWWKTPDEALAMPERVIAQIMDIGDYPDVLALVDQMGEDVLRDVLRNAQAGQFRARSWHYWHYRLGMATIDHMPDMPTRAFE